MHLERLMQSAEAMLANALALAGQGPPSILEPLVPSFRTTTTTTTSTTTTLATTSISSSSITAIPTAPIHAFATTTLLNNLLENVTVALYDNATATIATTNATHTNTTNAAEKQELRYSISMMIFIGFIAAILSIVTVAGNVMVMISFKIDKQLQTISNYFLFSLAIADFAIGLISIPLFSVTLIMGYWPLGPIICDTWLALDYLASNASVLNLLIISFDRYFSVTRPLTYRAKRTTNRAAVMIAAAWGISLLLWPPWIYSWPYIEGKRTVPENACYIQFIETNHYITFGTALAAFYFPVTIMCFLYYRIWRETKKRQKDLPNLQAGKKDSSKRSNSSDENTVVNHSGMLSFSHIGTGNNHDQHEHWRRPRSESSADVESVYMTNLVNDSSYQGMHSRKSSIKSNATLKKHPFSCMRSVKEWCIAWWHSGREDSDDFPYEPEDVSDIGCNSVNMMRDNYSVAGSATGIRAPSIVIPEVSPSVGLRQTAGGGGGTASSASAVARHSADVNSMHNRISSRSVSQDSVYTILIRLPSDGATSNGGTELATPSIKMIHDDVSNISLPATGTVTAQQPGSGVGVAGRRTLPSRDSEFSLPLGRRMSHATHDLRIPLNAKIIPKQFGKGGGGVGTPHGMQMRNTGTTKKKKKSQEKRQESKAAKTLSAILLSFIITWTPYNILVLIKPLTTQCDQCIPRELWDFFYALCYINSTINPVCYALCNASFRRTYIRILTCKWQSRNREGMVRGVYN